MDLIGGISSLQLGSILCRNGYKKVKSNELFDYYEEVHRDGQYFFKTMTLPASDTLLKWGLVNRVIDELFCGCKDKFVIFYGCDTIFPAGKYKGRNLYETWEVDCEYIQQCILNVDYFFLWSYSNNPKNKVEKRNNFIKMRKIFSSLSKETLEFYKKKEISNGICFDEDYGPPEMPNAVDEWNSWMNNG